MNTSSTAQPSPAKRDATAIIEGGFPCKVLLLDATDINVPITRKSLGRDLCEKMFELLGIIDEKDYFGLQFLDPYHVHHWLDPLKRICKQVPVGPPYTFRFRVKFYSSDPTKLRDEMTKYQFFLQLKSDVQSGRLECTVEMGVELAALALQSEFGDYNAKEHDELFVSEFRFHPHQDASMDLAILMAYNSSLCRGLSPGQAETKYLEKVRLLEFYGVDMHLVEGKDGNEYRLGLTPYGMLIFDGRQKIGQFLWGKTQKLDFHDKKLTLAVEEEIGQANGGSADQIQLHTFVFELSSTKACKHLWKCAIEYHTFFRLKHHNPQKKPRVQFFRLGSTFRHRGRTEYEYTHSQMNGKVRERRIERRPSQRHAPRQRRMHSDGSVQRDNPDACCEPSKIPNNTADVLPSANITVIKIEGDASHVDTGEVKTGGNSSRLPTHESRIPKYLPQKTERNSSYQPGKRGMSMENGGFCGDSSEEENSETKSHSYNTDGVQNSYVASATRISHPAIGSVRKGGLQSSNGSSQLPVSILKRSAHNGRMN